MPTTLISIGPVIPVLAGVTYAIPDVLVTIESGPVQYSKVYGSGYASLVGSGPIRWGFIRPSGDTTVKLTRIPWNGKTSTGNPLPSDDYSYANRVILDGAVAYWKLNESSGLSARDSVGNAHGTISGGVTLGQVGVIDSCMKFDGVDDKIVTGAVSVTSIELWVKTSDTAQKAFINNIVGASTSRFYIDFYNSKLHVHYSDMSSAVGDTTLNVGPVLTDGQWHHIVVNFGSDIVCYADGVFVSTMNVPFTAPLSSLEIGSYVAAAQYFNGSIDEVAIYNKALTPAQILAHYNARSVTQPTSYSDLVRQHGASNYWRLGESSGLVAYDSIGGANGTISGGVTLGQDGIGKSMLFNGTTGAVITGAGSVQILVPSTVEAWVKPTNLTGGFRAAASSRSGTNGYLFGVYDAGVVCYSDASTPVQINAGVTLALGLWYHLVLVRTATTVTFYVNGIVYGPFAQTHAVVAPASFGISDAGNGNPWAGIIDEVAIYPRALTAQEILTHYNSSSKSVQAPIPYQQIVLNDKPSNYWRLNELTGTTASDVAGGAHGTISGGVTLGQAGALSDDKGMVFNGVDGTIISIPSAVSFSPGTISFSIEAWIKTTNNNRRILIRRGVNPTWFSFHVGLSSILLETGSGGTTSEANIQVNDGQWHHCIVVRVGVLASYYIDGVAAGFNTVAANIQADGNTAIGSYASPSIQVWDGSLDEVAIYPYALTPQQIANHYRARR